MSYQGYSAPSLDSASQSKTGGGAGREGYSPPDLSTNNAQDYASSSFQNAPGSNSYGGGAGGGGGGEEDLSKPVNYICGDCDVRVVLKKNDPIRCKECGYRVIYKARTNRMIQFEAR